MAPRLAHRKSRKGCQRCKARKVKCDELHPVCTNCSRHQVPCEYNDPFVRNTNGDAGLYKENNSGSSSSANPSLHGPESPYTELEDIDQAFDADERRLLELRLLHHFMTVVTYTFPASYEQFFQDMWNVTAVRIAFDQPFLLSAILAIASLHLVSSAGGGHHFYAHDKDVLSVARVVDSTQISLGGIDHAKAHRIFLNQAVRQQREAISTLSPQNADAIFLSSILLSYQALKLLPDSSSATKYTPPIQWLSMSKSITAVVQASRSLVQNDSVLSMLITTESKPDFRDHDSIFNPQFRVPFLALLDWTSYPEPDFDPEIKHTYEETLAYIGGVYQGLLDKEPPRIIFRRLMTFGAIVPGQFVKLLERGRPRALAILAHHFAMMKAVDDHWWTKGTADREVNGIRTMLTAEWQWAMEWPLSMLHRGTIAG